MIPEITDHRAALQQVPDDATADLPSQENVVTENRVAAGPNRIMGRPVRQG